MSRFDRLTVLNRMIETGMVPVFYHQETEIAIKVVAACAAGGARLIEFTNRGDFAPVVFLELARYFAKNDPSVILGVGSVVDAPTAALYLAYGANFVVGPVLNEEVARVCNRRKVTYAPGCGSASEISRAEELGCEIVKVFPGDSVGGPNFVKSILGPCPWTRIMPTGGVSPDEESLKTWFGAGVACVGMGSNLIRKEYLEKEEYGGITRKVEQTLALIRKIRGQNVFVGVEHIGLYHENEANAQRMAEWYETTFGFTLSDKKTAIFTQGPELGWLEIIKSYERGPEQNLHVAIKVSHFEAALELLKARGIELEEPVQTPAVKLAFLKHLDPAGHPVHLVWRP